VSENRGLNRIYGPKREEVAEEDCITRAFVTCMLHKILYDQIKEDEMHGSCSRHGGDEKCI
jgi:hypothetical protein